MRWRHLGLLVGLALFPSSAAADSVVFVGPGGQSGVRNDPYLTVPASTPGPAPAPEASAAAAARTSRKSKKKTVPSELARLYHHGQITEADYDGYRGSWNAALGTERRLRGIRKQQMKGVIDNLDTVAATGMLTASRLPALFLTLDTNRQYWPSGQLLSFGDRVEFSGSQLVWEYYPGQGLELTVLGTFGKADGLYTAGKSQYPALAQLLGEMIPLASNRAGGVTWEYYFAWGGGKPPWTSAMSQGTGIEAFTRGYEAFRKSSPAQAAQYLAIAHDALAVFRRKPKLGVGMPTRLGTRFVQYSFAPSRKVEIINAFLQTLIGLYDYAQVSGDAEASALFTAGNAEAESEVPHYDTGAWSLYQPGQEDDLSYHELVTGFLQQLCSRTGAPVYCTTAQHFQTDLVTPPQLTLLTTHARGHSRVSIRFRLSKISRVGIVVLRGSKTEFSTSATFAYGARRFSVPHMKDRGTYTIHMSATDLAGNFSHIAGSVTVTH